MCFVSMFRRSGYVKIFVTVHFVLYSTPFLFIRARYLEKRPEMVSSPTILKKLMIIDSLMMML